MSPDALASPRDAADAHADSTRALLALLDDAVGRVEAEATYTGRFHVGRHACWIMGNDAALTMRLTRCLVAAEDGSAPSDLTLAVLRGSAVAGAAPPPWNLPHTSPRHLERLHVDQARGLRAFYDHDRRFWSICDAATRRGLFWIADTADVPFWEEAAPFKATFNWFLAGTSATLLHAGVVAHRGRGVLLAGPGGSGKSTTVMAAVAAGLGTCGDDLVVVDDGAGAWTAYALYDAAKFFPAEPTGRVPDLFTSAAARPCGDKLLVRYSDVAPGRLVRSVPLVALVHCVISGQASTTITPLAPGAMLRALGPPTAFLLRGAEPETLRKAAALVRAVPSFTLALGTNPAEAIDALKVWIDEGCR
ncbi:MAG: hypothetical protein WCR51_10580 [Planctomycetia bacterium]